MVNINIYSIESRKGGVGKTTIALNLAKILSRKGKVLLLDCDFMGTSLYEAIESSNFWKKHIIIPDIESRASFITLFEENATRKFQSVYPKDDSDKRNIYALGSTWGEDNHKIGINVFYDELHVMWLINSVKNIVDWFVTANLSKEDVFSVIIDNTPGYSSFLASLHKWMLQEYIASSKFIYVSSFDSQDIKSCTQSAKHTLQEINDYIQIRDIYKTLKEDKISYVDSVKISQFLKEHDNVASLFYDLVDRECEMPMITPEKSLALVINRVPNLTINEEVSYSYEELLGSDYNLFLTITDGVLTQLPQTLVRYNEDVCTQFIEGRLKTAKIEQKHKNLLIGYFTKTLDDLNKTRGKVSYTLLEKYGRSYDTIIKRLESNKFARFARILQKNEGLNPSYPLELLKTTTRNLVVYTNSIGKIGLASGDNKSRYDACLEQLSLLVERCSLSTFYPLLNNVLEYLMDCSGYHKKGNESLVTITTLFWGFFCALQQARYNGKMSYRDFLLLEYNRKDKIVGWESIIQGGQSSNTPPYSAIVGRMLNISFYDFYHSMCYTLIRMIDFNDDYERLLQILKELVQVEASMMPNELIKILKISSIEKLDGLHQFAKLVAEEDVRVGDFSNILKKHVFNRWN